MARLIDADALREHLSSYTGMFTDELGFAVSLESVLNGIDFQPTIDAVEVVRCKDCAVPHNKWTGCPKLSGLVPPPHFYCYYGERREGE